MVWNDIVQNQYEDMVRQQENEVQDMVRQMFFIKFASLAKHMQSVLSGLCFIAKQAWNGSDMIFWQPTAM